MNDASRGPQFCCPILLCSSKAPTLPVRDLLPDAKWSKYPPMRRNPADSLGFQPGVSHLSDAVPLRVTHSA